MNQHDAITLDTFLICMLLSFVWGGAAKTYIDGCFFRRGVREGYRVGIGDIDSELDEARRVLRVPLVEDDEMETYSDGR